MNAIVKFFGAVDFMDTFIEGDNGNVQGIPNRSVHTTTNVQEEVMNASVKKTS